MFPWLVDNWDDPPSWMIYFQQKQQGKIQQNTWVNLGSHRPIKSIEHPHVSRSAMTWCLSFPV